MKPKYEGLLIIIVPQVVEIISKKHKVDPVKATRMFYNSTVYEKLANEKTKFWHFSPLTLYNMFDEEIKTGSFQIPEGI